MTTPSIDSLRRRAHKLGYRFYKSNWRKDTIDNCGGYQILDTSRNLVVDGVKYDLALDYVAAWIEDMEKQDAA